MASSAVTSPCISRGNSDSSAAPSPAGADASRTATRTSGKRVAGFSMEGAGSSSSSPNSGSSTITRQQGFFVGRRDTLHQRFGTAQPIADLCRQFLGQQRHTDARGRWRCTPVHTTPVHAPDRRLQALPSYADSPIFPEPTTTFRHGEPKWVQQMPPPSASMGAAP